MTLSEAVLTYSDVKNILSRNLAEVRERICRAAERVRRNPEEIQLVAVTKTVGVDIIRLLGELGQKDIGENRVQDGIAKAKELPGNAFRWHLIGHLQTNKVKKAVAAFEIIHSLDSLKLVESVRREAQELNKTVECLIEVNVSGEESKFGIKPEMLADFYRQTIGGRGGIIISGLMAMAPIIPTGGTAEICRPYFRRLKELLEELKSRAPAENRAELRCLSMGMSQDFEVAVEEGANILRVGSALFEGLL